MLLRNRECNGTHLTQTLGVIPPSRFMTFSVEIAAWSCS